MINDDKSLESKMKAIIRDVPDFPKPGILFKDLSPLLKDIPLAKEVIQKLAKELADLKPDALVCLESRGFWFGMSVAIELGIPMIPLRKQGKLPYTCIAEEYELEYGTAKIEMHTDALKPGWKVVIHDDLLATGGTANAAARLVKKAGAELVGFSFLVELEFLKGREFIQPSCPEISSLVKY